MMIAAASQIFEQNARRSIGISDRGYVLEMGRNRFAGRGPELLENEDVAPTVSGWVMGGGACSV